MPHIQANGIRIEFETFGSRADPALLLIAGNGAQLLFWETEFCEMLADTGFFVILLDNRDAGLSTKFEEAGSPDFMGAIQAVMAGKAVDAPYSLNDMADDCIGLLDAMHIEKAHICGASMGGMIAQVVAYRHPQRILSLTSIMSNTGNPQSAQGHPDALAAVVAPSPTERNAYIEHNMKVWRKIWSPGFPFEEERAHAFLENSYDRSFCPSGAIRQNIAILACGDRTASLTTIKAPALIIHGSGDPLIPLDAGKEAARAIPESRLLVVEGMGHDLPKGAWSEIVTAISKHLEHN